MACCDKRSRDFMLRGISLHLFAAAHGGRLQEDSHGVWRWACRAVDVMKPVCACARGNRRPSKRANRYARNSTIPVSRLYIEPAIFMAPLDSRPRSTGLFSRMLPIVSDTFFRATASTNA